MKKYGYPIIIVLLIVIASASLYVAATNHAEISNVKKKYTDLDKKYNSLQKEDKTKDSKLEEADKNVKTKDSQINELKKKTTDTTNSVENQSVTTNSSANEVKKEETNNTGTESDLESINAFAEEKKKEQEAKENEPQYAVSESDGFDFVQQHGLSIDEFNELNPNVHGIKKGETYRIK